MDIELFLEAAQAATLARMRREDEEVAAELQVAHGGDPEAAYRVACRLHFGDGVEQNLDGARNWYERAAKAGVTSALHHLAVLLEERGEDGSARAGYERAAEIGDAAAMHRLGKLFAEGARSDSGSDLDHQRAEELFARSAAAGFLPAQVDLATSYRQGTDGDSTQQFVDLVRQAAAGQDPAGLFHFAACLRDGRGVPEDAERATQLMRRAAVLGHEAAAAWLDSRGLEPATPWDWEPGVRLGPIAFGTPVQDCVAALGLAQASATSAEDSEEAPVDGFWDSEFFGVSIQTSDAEEIVSVTFDQDAVACPRFRGQRILQRRLGGTFESLQVDDWTVDTEDMADDAWFESEALSLTLHVRDGRVNGASFDLDHDASYWSET